MSDFLEGAALEKGDARSARADALRNIDRLLTAAMDAFTTSGVDCPVREIASKAGLGIGTIYRHFPQRSDLIKAVFCHEVDACADAAAVLAGEYSPEEALRRWIHRYVEFIAAKRGLSTALHSGNAAYDSLPAYFEQRLRPAFQTLLESAEAIEIVRTDVDPAELLRAVSVLCRSAQEAGPGYTQRMVDLLLDGLFHDANRSSVLTETDSPG